MTVQLVLFNPGTVPLFLLSSELSDLGIARQSCIVDTVSQPFTEKIEQPVSVFTAPDALKSWIYERDFRVEAPEHRVERLAG